MIRAFGDRQGHKHGDRRAVDCSTPTPIKVKSSVIFCVFQIPWHSSARK